MSRLQRFSQLALASTGLTSYSLLFFHPFLLWPYGIISSVPYTSLMLFPLPGMPSRFSHRRRSFIYSTKVSSLLQSSQTTPGRQRHSGLPPFFQSRAFLPCSCRFPQETVSSSKAGTGLFKVAASYAARDLSQLMVLSCGRNEGPVRVPPTCLL